jgi:hypothetical protein
MSKRKAEKNVPVAVSKKRRVNKARRRTKNVPQVEDSGVVFTPTEVVSSLVDRDPASAYAQLVHDANGSELPETRPDPYFVFRGFPLVVKTRFGLTFKERFAHMDSITDSVTLIFQEESLICWAQDRNCTGQIHFTFWANQMEYYAQDLGLQAAQEQKGDMSIMVNSKSLAKALQLHQTNTETTMVFLGASSSLLSCLTYFFRDECVSRSFVRGLPGLENFDGMRELSPSQYTAFILLDRRELLRMCEALKEETDRLTVTLKSNSLLLKCGPAASELQADPKETQQGAPKGTVVSVRVSLAMLTQYLRVTVPHIRLKLFVRADAPLLLQQDEKNNIGVARYYIGLLALGADEYASETEEGGAEGESVETPGGGDPSNE